MNIYLMNIINEHSNRCYPPFWRSDLVKIDLVSKYLLNIDHFLVKIDLVSRYLLNIDHFCTHLLNIDHFCSKSCSF